MPLDGLGHRRLDIDQQSRIVTKAAERSAAFGVSSLKGSDMRAVSVMGRYLLNVLIALDQLVNALAFGDPDETISSRCAKAAHGSGWWRLGQVIEEIDPGHLARTIEADEGKDALDQWRA